MLAAALSSPFGALAGTADVVTDHVLPATEAFAQATSALSDAAAADCRAEALRPAYQRAFDAWMGIAHLGFGPLEQDGRALTIEFWPDPRGLVARNTARLATDPAAATPEGLAQQSIAGRGLMALDQMLYSDDLSAYQAGDPACRYVTALAADLAAIAAALRADWQDHATLMTEAGAPGNTRYLSDREAAQALYTALLSSLEFDADQRLGRPMGSFDKPRPKLAEAWRSDRPLANLALSLAALRDLAERLAEGPIPATEAAFGTAQATAAGLTGDPRLEAVATPQGRLKLEILQQQIRDIGTAIEAEIGGGLNLTAGFNSKDGD